MRKIDFLGRELDENGEIVTNVDTSRDGDTNTFPVLESEGPEKTLEATSGLSSVSLRQ